MNESERVRRLNKYLLSKGLPPKNSGTIDYVKENISRFKKRPAAGNGTILHESDISNKKGSRSEPSLKKLKIAHRAVGKTTTSSKANKTLRSNRVKTSISETRPSNTPKPVSHKKVINELGNEAHQKQPLHTTQKSWKSKKMRQTSNPAIASRGDKKEESSVAKSSEAPRKKLVRRSVHVTHQKEKGYPRTPKNRLMKSKAPSSSLAKTPTRRLQCRSAGPKIAGKSYTNNKNKTGNTKLSRKQLEMYDKLNSWLIEKGKKPLDSKKLRGFKAVKTISTPVGSPSQSGRSNTNGGSHWQGLRDEDDSDEITVLIKHTLAEVQNCINEGCSTETLVKMLEELADNLPVAKQQASYWITVAEIEQLAGKSEEFICDLYEKAIQAKAKPVAEIMEALKRFVMDKVEGKSKVPMPDEDLDLMLPELEGNNVSGDIAQLNEKDHSHFEEHETPHVQMKTPNPAIERLIRSETPLRKNVATSPIVFSSPGGSPISVATPEASRSCVVKLLMVPKSSPIFNKYVARRGLSTDTSAIVTPVRRSRRIEAAQGNYPKGLRDHEPCLSSVQELLPALEKPSDASTTACNILFNPNHALSKEGCDIATVLRF